jgi:hypothetical protein
VRRGGIRLGIPQRPEAGTFVGDGAQRVKQIPGRPGEPIETGHHQDVANAPWASDASAIASCPALRAPAGLKAPVTIDEILEALCELDGGPRNLPGGKPNRRYSTSRVLAA